MKTPITWEKQITNAFEIYYANEDFAILCFIQIIRRFKINLRLWHNLECFNENNIVSVILLLIISKGVAFNENVILVHWTGFDKYHPRISDQLWKCFQRTF